MNKLNDPLVIEKTPEGPKIHGLKSGYYLVSDQVAEWLEEDEYFAALLSPYQWFRIGNPDCLGNYLYWFYHFVI